MRLAETWVGNVDALAASHQLGDKVWHRFRIVKAALGAGDVPILVSADRARLGNVGAGGNDWIRGAVLAVPSMFSVGIFLGSVLLYPPLFSGGGCVLDFNIDANVGLGLPVIGRHGVGR